MCLFMFGASISHNDSYDFKNSLYIESVGETLWNLLGQMKSLFLSTFCWTQQIKPLGSRWIITHHLAVFIFPLLSLSASFSVCLRFCLFTSLFVCFAYMYVVFASICILCLCRTVLLCVGLSILLRFDLSLSFCQSIHPVIHESTYFNIYWSITECFFSRFSHSRLKTPISSEKRDISVSQAALVRPCAAAGTLIAFSKCRLLKKKKKKSWCQAWRDKVFVRSICFELTKSAWCFPFPCFPLACLSDSFQLLFFFMLRVKRWAGNLEPCV